MATNKNAVFFNFAVVLALLLIVAGAEGRLSLGVGSGPTCASVYGVKSGDTCTTVRQAFALTPEKFSGINPNLNCDILFVGQWLCVFGTA